jgi:peptidoglycan hydrolase-like protein with peptidoglycan-binding domain
MSRALTRSMRWNSVYGLPVAPIAGTYRGERPRDLRAFRCLAARLGADGVSYWSLQHTRPAQLPALALPTSCAGDRVSASRDAATALRTRYATVRFGTRGDHVTWLQGRLRAWGAPVPRTGLFRTRTRAAVIAFQRARGLRASGVVDGRTWDLLLQRPRPAETSRTG